MNLLRMLVGCLVVSVVLWDRAIAQPPPSKESVRDASARLRKIKLGSLRPVTLFGEIYLAGQPKPEELPLLKAQGIRTIISLRHAKELTWDESIAVKQAGMKFVHAPFNGSQQLTPEIFDKTIRTLRDKRSGPMLLHCGVANRVGAIWYAYRVLDGKLSPAEAEKEAKQVGLRTPAYLEKAKEYVKAVQAGDIELKELPPVEP